MVGGFDGLYFIVLDESGVGVDGDLLDGWLVVVVVGVLGFEVGILLVIAALGVSHLPGYYCNYTL